MRYLNSWSSTKTNLVYTDCEEDVSLELHEFKVNHNSKTKLYDLIHNDICILQFHKFDEAKVLLTCAEITKRLKDRGLPITSRIKYHAETAALTYAKGLTCIEANKGNSNGKN